MTRGKGGATLVGCCVGASLSDGAEIDDPLANIRRELRHWPNTNLHRDSKVGIKGHVLEKRAILCS